MTSAVKLMHISLAKKIRTNGVRFTRFAHLGVGRAALESFAHGDCNLAADVLQALAKELFPDHVFSAEDDLLYTPLDKLR